MRVKGGSNYELPGQRRALQPVITVIVSLIFVFKTSQLAEKEEMEKQIREYVTLNTPRNPELKIIDKSKYFPVVTKTLWNVFILEFR